MGSRQKFQIDFDEQFPHLHAAPIVEAVIQWTARPQRPFDETQLLERLRQALPDYPDCHPQHELQIAAHFEADGSSHHVRNDSWRGFRLTSADKLNVAQFNRDGLVFSRLRPYDRWEAFVGEALRLWELFLELAEPTEVQRLGVRFINRIGPMEIGDLGKYLVKPPRSLDQLGLPMSSFLYRSTHDVPELPLRVNILQTIQPPTPPDTTGYGLILDLDVFTTRPISSALDQAAELLEKMRWLKDKAFFNLLHKRALKLFAAEVS